MNLSGLHEQKENITILGTGFAAFSVLKQIGTAAFNYTVISPGNHFLFTLLLLCTTVGTIEFRSVVEPVRAVYPEVLYYHSSCREIIPYKHMVRCESEIDGKYLYIDQ